jgi:hypothetical protein
MEGNVAIIYIVSNAMLFVSEMCLKNGREWYVQICRVFYLWERIKGCVNMFGAPHDVIFPVVTGGIYIPLICMKI